MHSKQYKTTIKDIADATGQNENAVRRHIREGKLVMTTVGMSEYIVANRLLARDKTK